MLRYVWTPTPHLTTHLPVQYPVVSSKPVFVLCPGDTPWAQVSLRLRLEALGDTVCLDSNVRDARVQRSDRFGMLYNVVRKALQDVCSVRLRGIRDGGVVKDRV